MKTRNKAVAEKIRKQIELKIALGDFGILEDQAAVRMDTFFEEYFAYAVSIKKASTIRNERNHARQFLGFVGAGTRITEINKKLLDLWKAKVLETYSVTSFDIMRRFLHMAFNLAKSWGYVKENPVSGMAKIKVNRERIFLNDSEFGKVLALLELDIANPRKRHLKKFNSKLILLLQFLSLTGLRRQEAMSLDKGKLDFRGGVIHIEKTKGKEPRDVPMHPRVREILEVLDLEIMFRDMTPSSVSHKFKSLTIRAKLGDHFKLHSIRHTFAVNLKRKGVDISVIQSLLGHADIRTTLIYSKTTSETMKLDINKLDVPQASDGDEA